MADTEPTDADAAPTLPGLELDTPMRAVGELERQVRRSLARLEELGLVGPEHAGLAQLAIELAQAIGRAAARGQAAAVGLSAAQLVNVFDKLNPADSGGGAASDDFTRWQRELHSLDSAGGTPPVGHTG